MIGKIKQSKIFTSVVLPIVPMLLWGTLFPVIKIGYKAFDINTKSVADIIMFAALRFMVCGIIVSSTVLIGKDKKNMSSCKQFFGIIIMGMFAVVLHYSFTYIGLSITESSKAAVLKQLGTLFYVCFAFIFSKNEKFSFCKIFGALIGFGGIIAMNLGTGGTGISVGDNLIIMASVCTVIANIISKRFSDEISPILITGVSQLSGGIVLFGIALIMGAKSPVFTIEGVCVFAYICIATIVGYTVWYYVQRTTDLSRLFIIKFAEPLFACVFSAVLLNENIFKLQYLIAFALISTGIALGNKNK